ncbi:MAG: DUF1329 domain-containing protein [Candidatus Omnitrophica bacterium]|nr:DUF1329 domain-containing protein [Candidatus Omnitrophota bacterium]
MKKCTLMLMAAVLVFSLPVFASEKLTPAMTNFGAEKAGNSDGTIPEWNGGITTPPQSYKANGFHPDPFANDKPLFTITASNWTQYKDKLSAAHQMMFETYPDYQIPVYPTRRSASTPDFVYEALKFNAENAQLTSDGNDISGGRITSPFPVPTNGLEAIWNHLLRYRGQSLVRKEEAVAVASKNHFIVASGYSSILFPYSLPGSSFDSPEDTLAYYKQKLFSPPRLAGTLLLVHEMLDKVKEKRRSWLYNPGQRRVSRAPFINYDTYAQSSEGLRTYDQFDMFNGATDRYNWTLEGKQEIFVPYNAYRLANKKLNRKDILDAHFLNSNFTRYELHRVWKVSAVLKENTNHIYARRVFYLDEDSWQILICEQYDGRGDLWRFSEAHVINYYEIPVLLSTADMHYDLKSGQYLMEWQIEPIKFNTNLKVDDFTPETLRQEGIR